MKGIGDRHYVVIEIVLCALLVISCVETQNIPSSSFDTGRPLPPIKQGQGSNVSPTKYTIIHKDNSRVPNIGVPLPNLGQNVGGTPVRGFSSSRGRGPGSLQHIKEPSLDKGVSELISHPVVLKTIQKETRANRAVKVESVISAHKQLVSGQLTYLDLKVVKTKCPVGIRNILNCPLDATEDPFVCEVVVWQRPWLNTTEIIDEKTKCAEVEDDNDFKNWNKGNGWLRAMRTEILKRTVPDFLDEHQVALEAYDYINRGSESKFKGQMIDYKFGQVKYDPILNLTKIEVEIEYGFTLCLKFPNRKVDDRVCAVDGNRTNYICSVDVISDPQLTTNLKVMPSDDDDIDCHKRQHISEELVVPVKAVCMGCPQIISLNDPALLPLAEFAVIEYDRNSHDDELHKMIKLHKATTQVTNGIKYFLTIELADTDCRKPLSAVNMNRTLCNADFRDETDICEIVIHVQPWQKTKELVSSSCRDSFSPDAFIVPSHGFFGAQKSALMPVPISGIKNNPSTSILYSLSDLSTSMQESVKFLLSEINVREVDDSDDGLYKILNVIKASSVSEPIGEVDIIILELGETLCRGRERSGNCPLKFGEEHEICIGKVLKHSAPNEKTWRRVVLLNCDDKDDHFYLTVNPATAPFLLANRPFFTALQGSLGQPGGPIKQATDSTTTVEIAHFVVDQFNLQNDDDELYKFGKILSSYSQLSGSAKYTIELELLETHCKKYQPLLDVSKCPIDISEQPEICQAEVSLTFSGDGSLQTTKKLLRMFCDERKDYFLKKLAGVGTHSLHNGQVPSSTSENVNNSKIQALGKKIADEFDIRADEDQIFVLFKVLAAKSVDSGLSHRLRVELAETVCPKYKRKIDKSRCVIDIGEEHKICDALVTEQPWRGDFLVSRLHCFERDDSIEDDAESREVVYPLVHPSAHARPKFLQSKYRIRQHSLESAESNEQYYRHGRSLFRESREDDSIEYPRFNRSRRPRQFIDDDDDDVDSDRGEVDSRSNERRGGRYRHINRRIIRSNERFDRSNEGFDRSDEDSSRHYRFTRQLKGAPGPVDLANTRLKELAAFGIQQMDLTSSDSRLRRSEQILQATKQLVAGIRWKIKTRVFFTNCLKDSVVDLSTCELDTTEPPQECFLDIWERPWLDLMELNKSSRCSTVPI